jgi:hypothetical protein
MPRETAESNLPTEGLDILDDLISRYYKKILDEVDKNLKPGDLLKMIELRHKLAPSNADQEKFWTMLAKIRKDALAKQSSDKPTSDKTANRPSKKDE